MGKLFYEVLTVGGVLLLSAETLRLYMTSRLDRIESKLDMLRRNMFGASVEQTPSTLVNQDKSKRAQNG